MKGAAVVAEILKREGVQFVIGYPVNNVLEAAAQADIRTIIVRQERTGLHMAEPLPVLIRWPEVVRSVSTARRSPESSTRSRC